MGFEALNLQILFIFTFGFGFACILGYLTYRAHLSPILGYLAAGYLIGPYSPGYTGDLHLAEQLAEIGVILMMFGVGLHFKLQDLLHVRNIAITGAVTQIGVTAVVCLIVFSLVGWILQASVLFGIAIGVASTVVLIRSLTENRILHTPAGHIAVGWLIVEDIIVVITLVLVPALAASSIGESFILSSFASDVFIILGKFVLLVILLFTVGQKVVSWILAAAVKTKSHELFTLTILALTFAIATGSMLLFGTTPSLGAFFAGMLIGQTDLHRQVERNATPLRDTFVIIFFLSIGMLFNPNALTEHFWLFLAVLGIILIVKPTAAYLITIAMRHPAHTALTLAFALAQIGEFSFILAEESNRYNIIPDEGFDIIVACSIISIPINQALFKFLLPKQP